jgi:hypothetical protein
MMNEKPGEPWMHLLAELFTQRKLAPFPQCGLAAERGPA